LRSLPTRGERYFLYHPGRFPRGKKSRKIIAAKRKKERTSKTPWGKKDPVHRFRKVWSDRQAVRIPRGG